MKILLLAPRILPASQGAGLSMAVSFSAMMGSGASPEQAKGFDALGMFGQSQAVDAPMTPVGDKSGPFPEPPATQVSQAATTAEARFLAQLPGPRPMAVQARTRSAESVGPLDQKRPQVGPSDDFSGNRSEVLSTDSDPDSEGITAPPGRRATAARFELRRPPGADRRGGINVGLIETPLGTTLVLSGGVDPAVIEGFRDAALRLMARKGQALHKFIANGEDRSAGRAEKDYRSWR